MSFASKVRIVEVGPRDGIQDDSIPASSLETRIQFINMLSGTGLVNIETASFVSPKQIPRMSDSAELFASITKNPLVTYSALVPNLEGLKKAIAAGVDEVVIFAAASETFSKKNINCTITESLERFKTVIEEAGQHKIPVRGDIATAFGCPYEGDVDAGKVAELANDLFVMGCYEICLADTAGTGTPTSSVKLINSVSKFVPVEKLAVHFHDTNGLAMTNLYAVLQEGISVVDSSVAGLGGCPYASAAGGNVVTEDVVFMLESMGIETGVDLKKIIDAGNFISGKLGIPSASIVAQSLSGRKSTSN